MVKVENSIGLIKSYLRGYKVEIVGNHLYVRGGICLDDNGLDVDYNRVRYIIKSYVSGDYYLEIMKYEENSVIDRVSYTGNLDEVELELDEYIYAELERGYVFERNF